MPLSSERTLDGVAIDIVELQPFSEDIVELVDADSCGSSGVSSVPTPPSASMQSSPSGTLVKTASAKRVWFREDLPDQVCPITPPTHANRSGQFGSLFPNQTYYNSKLGCDLFSLDSYGPPGQCDDMHREQRAKGMSIGVLIICAALIVCYSINVLASSPPLAMRNGSIAAGAIDSVNFVVMRNAGCAKLAESALDLHREAAAEIPQVLEALSCYFQGTLFTDQLQVVAVPDASAPAAAGISAGMSLILVNVDRVMTATEALQAVVNDLGVTETTPARFLHIATQD
eukprot:TRINITY_DN30974_c0_g1_i1.p1 TRINITY_DN30974_c0_g1~~TRINITY_DN30974_c0_g1_i1.p1  ORF type:complete len:286 (+),score=75.67 TRINITY_DN30974_c0_g1_i1:561-1418(+)